MVKGVDCGGVLIAIISESSQSASQNNILRGFKAICVILYAMPNQVNTDSDVFLVLQISRRWFLHFIFSILFIGQAYEISILFNCFKRFAMTSADYTEDGITNPILNEEEPLLGPNGSVTQNDTTPIYHNFLTGWCLLGTYHFEMCSYVSRSLQELLWLLRPVSGW